MTIIEADVFLAEIVRVGGQSKSEELKMCNLRNKKSSSDLQRYRWDLRDRKEWLQVSA